MFCDHRSKTWQIICICAVLCSAISAEEGVPNRFGISVQLYRFPDFKEPSVWKNGCSQYVAGSLLQSLGIEVDEDFYDEMGRTINPNQTGVYANDLKDYLGKHFEVEQLTDAKPHQLWEHIGKGNPVVATVETTPGSSHSVLVNGFITGADHSVESVVLQDNGHARGIYPVDKFLTMWRCPTHPLVENQCMLLTPNRRLRSLSIDEIVENTYPTKRTWPSIPDLNPLLDLLKNQSKPEATEAPNQPSPPPPQSKRKTNWTKKIRADLRQLWDRRSEVIDRLKDRLSTSKPLRRDDKAAQNKLLSNIKNEAAQALEAGYEWLEKRNSKRSFPSQRSQSDSELNQAYSELQQARDLANGVVFNSDHYGIKEPPPQPLTDAVKAAISFCYGLLPDGVSPTIFTLVAGIVFALILTKLRSERRADRIMDDYPLPGGNRRR